MQKRGVWIIPPTRGKFVQRQVHRTQPTMQQSLTRVSSRACSCSSRPQPARAALPAPRFARAARHLCRAGADSSTDADEKAPTGEKELLSDDEMKKLAALQRQRQEQQQQVGQTSSSNIFQGALEEAQLITWPKPQKAFLDTLLVLAIVMGSGGLLFGVNVALANLSDWWYHQ